MIEATVRVRFRSDFPWKTLLDRHPDLVATSLHRSFAPPDRIVMELRIRDPAARDWSDELRSLPSVISVDPLARFGRPGHYRIRWRAPPFYPPLLDQYDLMGLVPIEIARGQATVSLALPTSRLRRLVRELAKRGFGPQVVGVRPFRGEVPAAGLTPTQRARFQAALDDGYFDVPRKTTLDELARKFSVRKASFAESLAIARKKVLLGAGRAVLEATETNRLAAVQPLPP